MSSATTATRLILSLFLVQRLIRDLSGTSASTAEAREGCQWTDDGATQKFSEGGSESQRQGSNEMPSKRVFCGNSNHWQTAIFGRFVESQLHLLGTRGRE
jgi:hypothetical protein